MLKVWTGTCWSWVKVRTLGRDVPEKFELGSPSLVCKAHEVRNEVVEELISDVVSESHGELNVEFASKGRNRGREDEKGRR